MSTLYRALCAALHELRAALNDDDAFELDVRFGTLLDAAGRRTASGGAFVATTSRTLFDATVAALAARPGARIEPQPPDEHRLHASEPTLRHEGDNVWVRKHPIGRARDVSLLPNRGFCDVRVAPAREERVRPPRALLDARPTRVRQRERSLLFFDDLPALVLMATCTTTRLLSPPHSVTVSFELEIELADTVAALRTQAVDELARQITVLVDRLLTALGTTGAERRAYIARHAQPP